MALLKIRDANGNVQEVLALRGNDYVLTDADKREIAEMVTALMSVNAVSGDAPDLSLYALKTDIPDLTGYALKSEIPNVSAFMTEAQVLALIQANMPTSGDEVSY